MVLKPSELTPLTALALAELARRAGLPPGVVNVVCGDAAAIADVLLASPEVGWECGMPQARERPCIGESKKPEAG